MFYQLFNVEELDDESLLELPRAISLYDACRKNRDFSVIQVLRNAEKNLECIVVDVQCDGVPSNNPFGVKYCERLVLCVSSDQQAMVEVLALRKDFPILMHQNNVVPNTPASLCLYFEPAVSVRRTWTPENFLRRIQWWLEKSARGDLHPADQPVEQLFFITKYELVLPWNFDELKADPEQKFAVGRGPARPDGGETFFLDPIKQGNQQGGIAPIEITLSAISHQQVEQDPLTLGGLVDMLQHRGADICTDLKIMCQSFVSSEGVPLASDESLSVILLHVPICRSADNPPERIVTKAFMMRTGLLRLGQKIGALISHEGRYYQDAFGSFATTTDMTWRDEALFPMEVLHHLDASASRFQSGIEEEGPDAVIVGVGSLGSMMLDLWGRSGWGRWSAIDKDHIKPHNLARHVAYSQHTGMLKVDVVAQLHTAVTDGFSKVVPIAGDVSNLSPEIVSTLGAAKLVVDASTTLDYPRLVSTRNDFGRHISVFITPDGNAAVLLAEDEDRTIRLRTLEAQYYRAIIKDGWGENHLDGNAGTYWSGASCRDISMVLPYSKIVGHAATLVEQVRLISNRPEAEILVWSRNPESGDTQVHVVPVFPERRFDFGDLELFVDAGVVQKLLTERAIKAPKETGGVLLGYHDFNINAIVIVDVLLAPADSEETAVSFERGIDGLQLLVSEAARRTAGIVQYVGEWHSHPPGHSASPSKDDLYQLAYLGLRMAEDGLPAVSLIVGENDIYIMKSQA